MITLSLAGAGFGAALFWLIALIRPPAPEPLVELGRFYAARAEIHDPGGWHQPAPLRNPAGPHPWAGNASRVRRFSNAQTQLGRRVDLLLTRRGVRYVSLRQDLALTGEPFDAALGRKVLAAVGGLLFGLLLAAMLIAASVPLPAGVPAVLALAMAAVFFLVPDLEARRSAAGRRREFLRALGAYLDWVSLQMSGRAAAEQALPDAARIGGGWPLTLIRHTVLGATRAGTDVWLALAQLGDRIGVTALRDLGALVQLVAHDGAHVRDTLTARAASLRAEELADAQGNAAKRDQSMLLAQILLGVGFAVFLGYPAVVNFLRI